MAKFEIGSQVPAIILMEVTALEGMETTPDGRRQIWQMQLKPVGEIRSNLIVSSVTIMPTK